MKKADADMWKILVGLAIAAILLLVLFKAARPFLASYFGFFK